MDDDTDKSVRLLKNELDIFINELFSEEFNRQFNEIL